MPHQRHQIPDVPVLFIAFNRYEEARQVLGAIRQARPSRLYFACDGARNEAERPKCEKVRSLVDEVDWPCEVRTKFSPVNLGVRHGEASAMDWFFEHEEMGIVLEDDTLPAPSFFAYCRELLHRYKDDERVWAIMGSNLMPEMPPRSIGSYHFSGHGYGAYWGWAGWRRVWRHYDVEMKDWPMLRDSGLLEGHFLDRAERRQVYAYFEHTWNGAIRSWDYQFDLARLCNHAVNIVPRVNMVRNIGFGSGGSHTTNANHPNHGRRESDIDLPLEHPAHMLIDADWDRTYFLKRVRPTAFRRFKYAVKALIPERVDKVITPALSKLQDRLGINRD